MTQVNTLKPLTPLFLIPSLKIEGAIVNLLDWVSITL